MAELRVTRPCRKCRSEATCAPYLRALRELVADYGSCGSRHLPDVVVDCVLYVPEHSRRPAG
jgi:hypothetical protein